MDDIAEATGYAIDEGTLYGISRLNPDDKMAAIDKLAGLGKFEYDAGREYRSFTRDFKENDPANYARAGAIVNIAGAYGALAGGKSVIDDAGKSFGGRAAVGSDFAEAAAGRAAQQAAKQADDAATAATQQTAQKVDLADLLKQSTLTKGKPNQTEIVIDDGTKVIFRRDVGEYAHELDRVPEFAGKGRIDHYNIELHVKKQGVRNYDGSRYKPVEDVHIVPNGKGGYSTFGNDKKVIKHE